MKELEKQVPPVRVKFFDYKNDETFTGTVIDQKSDYYIVIPDYNLSISKEWKKMNCDILR